MIEKLAKQLMEQRGIVLTVTSSALSALVQDGYDKQFGARPLKRIIRRKVEDRLAEELLYGNVRNGDKVLCLYENGEYVFSVQK